MLINERELVNYIEVNIIPQYHFFDLAHNEEHVKYVINRSVSIADCICANREMSYVIAAYHDLGICASRENHALISADILIKDKNLYKWFEHEQLFIMKEAIEDHSKSLEREPRSIYGKIIYQADVNLDIKVIMSRALKYGITYYPQYTKQQQYERLYEYIKNKYGAQGHYKLWIDIPDERKKLNNLYMQINDKKKLYSLFEEIYKCIMRN